MECAEYSLFPEGIWFARRLAGSLAAAITRITTNGQTARGCHEPKVASAAAVGADISNPSRAHAPTPAASTCHHPPDRPTYILGWLTRTEDNAISVANKRATSSSSSCDFGPSSDWATAFVGGLRLVGAGGGFPGGCTCAPDRLCAIKNLRNCYQRQRQKRQYLRAFHKSKYFRELVLFASTALPCALLSATSGYCYCS